MAEKSKESPTKSRSSSRRGVVFINRERCKGCGYCVEFCPTKVLEIDEGFNAKGYHPPRVARPEACTGCDLCGLYCPDFAIHGERQRQSGDNEVGSSAANESRENKDAAA